MLLRLPRLTRRTTWTAAQLHPRLMSASSTLASASASSAAQSSSSSSSSSSGSGPRPGFVEIREGTASMFYDEKEAVFYNKVQVLNRDLSIQVIKLFSEIREKEKTERYQQKLAKYNELLAAAEAKGQATPSSSSSSSPKPSNAATSSSSSSSGSGRQNQIKPPYKLPTGIHILDALAATGLRSVRYLKEIPLASHVTINDLESAATDQARANCLHNGVDMDRVTIHTGDACGFMHEKRSPLDNFDVIDLDPYGTVSPFLDTAVQAIADGGLMCVTCTDMAVLCGSFPEKCYALYGSIPLKNGYVHEGALRILLHALESAASRHRKHIVPWLSLSVDFYVRVFVRVYESPQEVKRSLLKRGMVLQSQQCPSFFVQPIGTCSATKRGNEVNYYGALFHAPSQCPETQARLRVGGPYWTEAIHDQGVVDTLTDRLMAGSTHVSHSATQGRLFGIMTAVKEELKDCPLYYSLPELCATLRCITPTHQDIQAALTNEGYRYSQFHHDPNAVKTDAPPSFIWAVMRAWCRLHPPEGSKHKRPSPAAAAILANTSADAVSAGADADADAGVGGGGDAGVGVGGDAAGVSADANTSTNTSTITNPPVSFAVSEQQQAQWEKRRREAIPRFAPNPEEGWGPKRRAGTAAAAAGTAAASIGADADAGDSGAATAGAEAEAAAVDGNVKGEGIEGEGSAPLAKRVCR